MFEFVSHAESPEHFLQWWNDNPIVIGGDCYSGSPGFSVAYVPHTNTKTFELKIEPLQYDQLSLIRGFLKQLGCEGVSVKGASIKGVPLKIRHNNLILATAELYIDEDYRWALGEGEWFVVTGHPSHWILECGEHLVLS